MKTLALRIAIKYNNLQGKKRIKSLQIKEKNAAKKVYNNQEELFQSRLSSQLNMGHGLLVLSAKISWEEVEAEYRIYIRPRSN